MLKPPKPFHGPKLKVQRAKRHIMDLQTTIEAFFNENPRRVFIKDNTNPGQLGRISRAVDRLPDEFSLIIGDAVHNLRTALDLLMCDLVRHASPNEIVHKKVAFPFPSGRMGLNAAIQDRKIKCCANVMTALLNMEPQIRDQHTLGGLHELDLADKHRLIIPIFGREPSGFVVVDPELMTKDRSVLPNPRPGTHLQVDEQVSPAFQIEFGGGQPFEYEPVIPTLEQLAELVAGIILSFETICLGGNSPF
jgi:hypothetical protein